MRCRPPSLQTLLVAAAVAAGGVTPMAFLMAGSPVPVAEAAPIGDLETELKARLAELETLLESEESYKTNSDKFKQAASVAAVMAQGIVEHSAASDFKPAAPTFRDGAIKIARSKSFDDAKAGLAILIKAKAGVLQPDSKGDFDWGKLTRMHPSMEEMNARSSSLRRALKRLKDPEAAARDASVLALLSLATHDDTHEVKNEADKTEWYSLAKDTQADMTAVAVAIRAKDVEEARNRLAIVTKRCDECHSKFHNEE